MKTKTKTSRTWTDAAQIAWGRHCERVRAQDALGDALREVARIAERGRVPVWARAEVRRCRRALAASTV